MEGPSYATLKTLGYMNDKSTPTQPTVVLYSIEVWGPGRPIPLALWTSLVI